MAAEKPSAKPAPEPAHGAGEADAPKKGGKKTVLVAGIVVIVEVLTVVLTMMMAGGPRRATAEVPQAAATQEVEKDVEVKLVDTKLPNSQKGVLYLYDLSVVAKVAEKNKDKVTELLAARDAQIHDRIRAIVASTDPKALTEPGLETLRRQIAYQLEQDMGKELVKEVLIPKCTPIRMEY